jgi:hypothetical protein
MRAEENEGRICGHLTGRESQMTGELNGLILKYSCFSKGKVVPVLN